MSKEGHLCFIPINQSAQYMCWLIWITYFVDLFWRTCDFVDLSGGILNQFNWFNHTSPSKSIDSVTYFMKTNWLSHQSTHLEKTESIQSILRKKWIDSSQSTRSSWLVYKSGYQTSPISEKGLNWEHDRGQRADCNCPRIRLSWPVARFVLCLACFASLSTSQLLDQLAMHHGKKAAYYHKKWKALGKFFMNELKWSNSHPAPASTVSRSLFIAKQHPVSA